MQRRYIWVSSSIIIATTLLILVLSSTKAQITNQEQGQDDISVDTNSIHVPEITSTSSLFPKWLQRETISFAPDRVIVKFRDNRVPHLNTYGRLTTGSWSLNNVLLTQGVERAESLFPEVAYNSSFTTDRANLEQIQRLYLKQNSNVMDVVASLSAHPDVIYAEPDYLAHAAFTPDDPRYPDQWGLTQIQAAFAWDTTQGSAAVTIAIIDTGLDLDHPDLAGKLWVNSGEIAGNGIDDDGNGKVDDINGWDWVGNDNDPQDDIGHGTHVAGVAAAATNNNVGIAGVCPNCRVMSLKVLDAGGSGTYSDIADGIIYAADKGAKVINLSLGGYADSQLLQDAVAYASQYAVIIAAAGNDNKQDLFYPAAYDEYVVAVAATDNNDQKAAFANYGDWVDISAPGVSIWSAVYNDNYAAWSGSSMAVPFVSGVAGLIRSQNMGWSAGAVRGQLLHTLDKIDSLNPDYEGQLGAGRLNAANAVTTTAQPELSIANYAIGGVINGNPEPGSTVTMTVSLQNLWADAANVTAVLSTTDALVTLIDDTVNFGDISGYKTVTNTVNTFSFSVDGGASYNHPISFQLALNGNGGNYTSTIPYTVTVASGLVYVNGVIDQDTTWIAENTYIVTSDILINQGITLTIQPGTIIRLQSEVNLFIEGGLIADGLPNAPILFTADSVNPSHGYWGAFQFQNTAIDALVGAEWEYLGGSIIRNVRVEYGSGVFIHQSAPYISHVTFSKNHSTANAVIDGGYQAMECGHYFYAVDGNIYIDDPRATVVIRDSFFYDPIGHWGGGAGVVLNQGTGLILINNVFEKTEVAVATRSHMAYSVAYNNIAKDSAFCVNELYNSNVGTAFAIRMSENVIGQVTKYGSGSGGGSVVLTNTIGGGFNTLVNQIGGTYQGNNFLLNQGYYFQSPSQDANATYNFWGTSNRSFIDDHIYDYYDGDFSLGKVTYTTTLSTPVISAPAFLLNASLNPVSPIGNGIFTLTLDFSKPMSLTIQPTVTFGISPTNDIHIVSGNWISTTQWAGDYNVTYYTGDGIQQLQVTGAIGTSDGMEIPRDTRFTFEIATIGATSINAVPSYGQVALSWNASDLETTAGYNLYRATTSGGLYTRLNQTVMSTTSYTDTNVVNGTAYYYVVKLLTTDLYEMDYGDEIGTTPNDFTDPSIPMVVDDGTCTPNSDYLHATWSASDPESGISAYQYSIGTWAGGTDVINWTSVGTNTEVTRTGLSLIETVTYYVNVKAQNGVGTWSAVGNSDGIEINNGCPAVAFTATPRSGGYPLTVQFNDQSTGSVLEHLWNFGDGNSSSAASPSHNYNSAGTFTVTLTITGSVASSTRVEPSYIVVSEPPPVAAFAAALTGGIKPLLVEFTDQSTGVIDSWLWAFGDGVTSTLTSPTHTYITSGIYTVTLAVSGSGGNDDEIKTNYITVYEPVTAAFTADSVEGISPLEVTFDNQSSGDYTTSLWTFGDGGTSSSESPSYTYTTAGVYTVSLKVSGNGGIDTFTQTNYITVNDPPPVTAEFVANPTQGIAPLAISFDNQSTGDYTTSLWAFGDGGTSSSESPSYTYTTAGVYTVSLKISGNGGIDTFTRKNYIIVNEPPPVADFTATPTNGQSPLTVSFSDQSTGMISSWLWSFGDGITSTLPNPSYIYDTEGVYTVILTVIGSGGSDNEIKTNYIVVNDQYYIYLPAILKSN